MEHRWSTRIPISIKVVIHKNNLPVAVYKTNNIGLGGLSIATGTTRFAKNTVLEAEFELNGTGLKNDTDKGRKFFRVRSCVVYSSEGGIGIMFLDSDSLLFRTLQLVITDNGVKMPTQDSRLNAISA